ncbi:MAG: twitch domain-containing radical SAM protein [Bdellovibrionaceae bacterium]|nr:twitch domain-containing radical SAM protein [Bdellovibrionales bacterium]MCB9086177.1 twitch domain-containing radical SAM protein [Pseudobdellovibrionaceae bacterium]
MAEVDSARNESGEELRPEAISPTFCILPWIHLSTRPNGHLRLCCTANASSVGATQDKKYGGEVGILKNENGRPANLNETDLLSAWNNQYMRDVRQMMLRGDIPASCLKCFKEEEAGHRSKRNWETEYWSKRVSLRSLIESTSPEGSVPPTITYVDLRLGTKCNLKCVMCSPHDSSLWVSDWNKLYPQIENPELKDLMQWRNKGKVDGATYNWHVDNKEFWNQLYDQLPNLRQLYFAGGEATIIEEHFTLLEECIRRGHAKHIELRYNSNGIEIPDRLLDLWSHFQRVRFHFSIDSIGEMNDYIRYPSKWSDIEAQLRRLDATPDNIEVTVACAIQVLNIYYLPDFIKWKLAQGYRKINPWPLGAGLVNVHLVYHPAHLNIKVLPPEFKEKVARKYEEFYGWLEERFVGDKDFFESQYGISRLKGLVRFMMAEDWSRRMPQLREYIRLMDSIRGTDFARVFPEMAEIMDDAN